MVHRFMPLLRPHKSPAPPSALPWWARLAIAYLFLPVILFLFGWVNPWLAIPVAGCAALTVARILLEKPTSPPAPWDKDQKLQTTALLALAVGLALATGVGGFLPQSTDYLKHNLIFGDLIERPWPVRYPAVGDGRHLCYGLGYYLPPAALAKVAGPATLGVASLVWAATGLFLFFAGLAAAIPRRPFAGAIVFLFCAGLGVFWHLAKSGMLQSILSPGKAATVPEALLMDIGLYTSNLDSITRMLYQPQHAIPGWLGGILLHELLIIRRRWTEGAAVLVALLFWSPLTALALGLLAAAILAADPGSLGVRPILPMATALALLVVMAAWYIPHLPVAGAGAIWNLAAGRPWLAWYLAFLFLFAILPVAAVWWLESKNPGITRLKPVLAGAALLLILTPLYKLGHFSDLRMQFSGPAFLFVGLAMARALVGWTESTPILPYACLMLVFLAGAIFPATRLPLHLLSAPAGDFSLPALRKNGHTSIIDMEMAGFDVTSQYLGDSRHPMARWLLKPVAAAPSGSR